MTFLASDNSRSAFPFASDCAPPELLFVADLAGHGDRVAVLSTEEVITYAELDDRVRALCVRLGADRRLILIGAGNAIDPLVAYLAALRGGHAVLPASGDNDTTLDALVGAYDPDVVISAETGWSLDERRPGSIHRLHPDLALLLSTSGSTGSSKLVRLSHRNLQANAAAIAGYLAITPRDRAMTTLPMQYCYGLSVINSHLHAGAGIVLTELSVIDQCFWELFDAAAATSFAGVPHTFDLLDRVGFESMSLPTLRYITQAGGRLHPDMVRRFPRLSNGKPDYVAIQRHATNVAATSDVRSSHSMDLNGMDLNGDHRDGVRTAFAEILGTYPTESDSFVSLGGDSLSYVEMSIRLEELLGFLPRDWHLTPVGELAPAPGHRTRVAHIETSVVLRAITIIFVVGTHARLWHLPGGAHTLLGVAGYNFARFQLGSTTRPASIARIALPAICWIGVVAATTEDFAWQHAFLLNGQLGSHDARWGYWYIEATVQILVVLAVLFAVPAVRRLEHRRPFPFALAILAAGLAVRFDVVGLAASSHRISRPQDVFWLFALGWAAAQATSPWQRLVVSVLAVTSLPGFFGDTHREMIVAAGLLLILWVPTLPLPRRSTPIIAVVAGASLYIYLTHWQVYPPLLRHGPAVAVAGSVLVGIGVWLVARRLTAVVEDAIHRATGSNRAVAGRVPPQRVSGA